MTDALNAGFENVSIDLIFSLPQQTKERWLANLEQAVALNPTHLSCYSLIVEADTPLVRMVSSKQVSLLSPDADAALYEMTIGYLAERGYEQYEVSNFAKPGFKSRHNKNYWEHVDYFGFGPSAHSFSNAWGPGHQPERSWNIADLQAYCETLERGELPVVGMEHLSIEQLRNEEVFLGLRSEGVDLDKFRAQFGSDLLSERGLLVRDLLDSEMAIVKEGRPVHDWGIISPRQGL